MSGHSLQQVLYKHKVVDKAHTEVLMGRKNNIPAWCIRGTASYLMLMIHPSVLLEILLEKRVVFFFKKKGKGKVEETADRKGEKKRGRKLISSKYFCLSYSNHVFTRTALFNDLK